MEHEVRAAIAAAENDGNVRVIVLTGAGRGFCAGADMSLLSTVGKRNRRGATGAGGAAYRRDRRGHPSGFKKEVFVFPGHHQALIAAVNGPAVSLGLVIALYCDLRVASDASPL